MDMDESLDIDCILIDFSKAFDRVALCRLISKLSPLNLGSTPSSSVRKFLFFRKQYTVTNYFSTRVSDVTSGIPQGWVLGPLLFLFYSNYLPSHISSKLRLFADDCVTYNKLFSTSHHLALKQDVYLVNGIDADK